MTSETTFRSRKCLLLVLLACTAFSITTTGSAQAAGQLGISAVESGSASRPAFVPDWDGDTDSTMVEYRVIARSTVDVLIIDANGVVRRQLEHGIRDAGKHQVWWNGRNDQGNVLPPGAYRVRVVARPLAPATATTPGAPGEPGAANSGPSAVAGTTDVAVTLQAPALAIREVRLTRGSIGRSAKLSSTYATFDLTVAASVSAAIVDARGHVLRTLTSKSMRAGHQRVAWDGRMVGGKPAPDGTYALLVAATTGARPTQTMRVPLRVDRIAPRFAASKRVRAVSNTRVVTIPLKVVLGEKSVITFALGKRSTKTVKPAGTHSIALNALALGIRPSATARVIRIAMTAADETGNARRSVVTVVIPPARASKAPRPTPLPPDGGSGNTGGGIGVTPPPSPPSSTGAAMRWPVDGVVTSEFGPRGTGNHAGIDIGAPTGAPIIPAKAGTVTYVGQMSGYGYAVDVDHGNGFTTRYAHLSRFGRFVVGDRVSGLDEIGYVGCTGHCSGPHLHFEVRVAGEPTNPRLYMPKG